MKTHPEHFRFKVATEAGEFEQIHRLNYQTFVEEIPQHETNHDGRLVDKFHSENTYLICLSGKELAGMLALRGKRPFSLDQKVPDLDAHLPPGRSICELRLLAVDKRFRHGSVLPGLLSFMERYGTGRGYDTAIISGTTRQLRLYERIGFKAFGPLVGTPGAQFQPMILLLEEFRAHAHPILNTCLPTASKRNPVNFLPGPVAVHPSVRRAFSRPAFSHRSNTYLADLRGAQRMLVDLTGARRVELMLGSGTLANEAVGGRLSLLDQPGLILANGEFGERLIDQATRWGLRFEAIKAEWGADLHHGTLEQRLNSGADVGWLWAVHCETSTGVLNDIARLQRMCAGRNIRLCLDCISSLGLVPLDLKAVYLAASASGKGLGSFPGLAMVFSDHDMEPAPDRLPRYLDLGYYSSQRGVPFTQSSNLLCALKAALERIHQSNPMNRKRRLTGRIRARLRERGFRIIASEDQAAPGVITIALPPNINAEQIGIELETSGFLIAYQSHYLRERNWIQICFMGESRPKDAEELLTLLQALCPPANLEPVPPRLDEVGGVPAKEVIAQAG